jgi:transcriptional regulator with XRE-family HTH domain
MITKENAGEKLLDYRLRKKITQLEVSKKADISLPTISGIESGNITPQTMTVLKIANYLSSVGEKD